MLFWGAGAAAAPIPEVGERQEAGWRGRPIGGARQEEQAPGGAALKYELESIYQGPAQWRRCVCGGR